APPVPQTHWSPPLQWSAFAPQARHSLPHPSYVLEGDAPSHDDQDPLRRHVLVPIRHCAPVATRQLICCPGAHSKRCAMKVRLPVPPSAAATEMTSWIASPGVPAGIPRSSPASIPIQLGPATDQAYGGVPPRAKTRS